MYVFPYITYVETNQLSQYRLFVAYLFFHAVYQIYLQKYYELDGRFVLENCSLTLVLFLLVLGTFSLGLNDFFV